MKLLFTQDALVNAGAERSHLEILSRFSSDIEVTLVYFYPKHDLKEEYEKAGIRLIFLDIPESYHFPLAISRLVSLIKSEKPDLLISSLWRADQITRIASLITGVPLIGTLVNDSYSKIAWKDKKGLKHKIVYWLDRLTASIPIHWIANAQALAESHTSTLGLDASKISVIYRGRSIPEVSWERVEIERIEIERIENERIENERVENRREESERVEIKKKELGEAETDCSPERSGQAVPRNDVGVTSREFVFRFLSYGRLLERKGFQDAIQAFAVVNQKYSNSSFTIYGEGPYRSQLENLILKLGLTNQVFLPGKFGEQENKRGENMRIEIKREEIKPLLNLLTDGPEKYRGYSQSPNLPISNLPNLPTSQSLNPPNLPISQPLNLLLSSHCFLFPSWYEGFSGALVEAMMAGIPIIASDIPMNLEAVSSESALIFEVQNTGQLAEQMRFAVENPVRMAELGAMAREEAVARFDIEKVAKQYEGILRKLYLEYRGGLREGD